MKRCGPASLVVLLSLGAPAAAEEDIACEDAMNQQEINICMAQEFQSVDAELNVLWKDILVEVRQWDREFDGPQKGAEKALIAGQRGWIAYRDGQCELAGWEFHGGTMEPMAVSACKSALTRARMTELRTTIKGENR